MSRTSSSKSPVRGNGKSGGRFSSFYERASIATRYPFCIEETENIAKPIGQAGLVGNGTVNIFILLGKKSI